MLALITTIFVLFTVRILYESKRFMTNIEHTRQNVNSSTDIPEGYNLNMLNKILGDGEEDDGNECSKKLH